jgi:hypothetical protein
MPPRGSPRAESKPEEIIINSGSNDSIIGNRIFSQAKM